VATQTAIQADIRAGALTRIGVTDAGGTTTASDDRQASQALARLLDHLFHLGDIGFPTSSIPDAAIGSLIALLAAALVEDFGVPEARADRIRAEALAGRRDLIRMKAASGGRETVSFVNF